MRHRVAHLLHRVYLEDGFQQLRGEVVHTHHILQVNPYLWPVHLREHFLHQAALAKTARTDENNMVLAVQLLEQHCCFLHPVGEEISFYNRSKLKRIHIISLL